MPRIRSNTGGGKHVDDGSGWFRVQGRQRLWSDSALGINAQDIQNALYQGFGPSWVSTIYSPTSQYKVILELLPQFQEYPDSLSLLYLRSPQGSLAPLSAITKVGRDAGPLTINHSGQLPSVTIAFNLRPGFALGDAVAQVRELADRTLPARMTASFTGTAQAFQSSLKNLPLLIIIAILVVSRDYPLISLWRPKTRNLSPTSWDSIFSH